MPAAIGVNTAPRPISTRPTSSAVRLCARAQSTLPAANSGQREQQRVAARPAPGGQQDQRGEQGGRQRIGRHRLAGRRHADAEVMRQRRQDAADDKGAGADDQVDERKQPERARHGHDCGLNPPHACRHALEAATMSPVAGRGPALSFHAQEQPMAQYVFTMNRVGKIVPPKRQILKDISLSFFPGAKIGVLGVNGSGKSTLLKIMAGVDKDIEGEATPMPGLKIGYLPQEPQLDARADRARGGRARHRRRAGRQEAAGRGLCRIRRRERRLRQAGRRAGRAGSHHRRRRQREHRPAAGTGRRRAAPAALGRAHRRAVGRREAPRRAVPAAAVQARHAAARRADQPPGRRKRRVARALPAALPRHRGGHHPRPLLPRQRRRVDPRTRPRLAASPGRATTPTGWTRRKSAWSRSRRPKTRA